MIITNASKKTNQADTDQCTQAAQGRCPAAEVEQTAPSIQIDLVYIHVRQKVLSFKNGSKWLSKFRFFRNMISQHSLG